MAILYHASTNKSLGIIEPQRTLSRDKYIGDFIFATPNRQVAAMYLAPKSGGTILINTFNNEPFAVINNNSEDFKKVDTGGAIYELPSDTFEPTPQAGMKGTELVSRVAVKALRKDVYDTSLAAMEEMGVKVYFVEGELFEQIKTAKDHGLSILLSLRPYSF